MTKLAIFQPKGKENADTATQGRPLGVAASANKIFFLTNMFLSNKSLEPMAITIVATVDLL